jgi:asparagine synthase (glutamine-hydrolysing)
MCGVLGWVDQRSEVNQIRFEEALHLLTHRGPDDYGIWASESVLLGHRRLSIIDRSHFGHQPMVDQKTGSVLIFNGEIYNHHEIRKELEAKGYQFRGQSDSETLLIALVHWGEKIIPRLNGMWAFAFWKPETQSLLLSRDRFGAKPLYFRKGRDGFAFASEPKALLHLFPQHRSVCESTLLDFLTNNQLYGRGDSFYKGIQVFPPAHYGFYKDGSLNVTQYWRYPDTTDEMAEDLQPSIEAFDELFNDAVRLRLRADVSVGVTLSGGLDSTSVLTAAQTQHNQPLTCFTSTYSQKGLDEYDWAQKAAHQMQAPLIPVHTPSEDWMETLKKIAWHMDAPGYSPAVYPLWHLMSRAKENNIPVLLEGQGADEALAGYPEYAVLDFLAYLKMKDGKLPTISGVKKRMNMLQQTFTLKWSAAWALRFLSPAALRLHRRRTGFQSILRPHISLPSTPEPDAFHTNDPVQSALVHDHASAILPGLLHYGDAISMAHSIESRNPFLDYRLVEWMFKMPPSLRFHENETKWILRHYLRRHKQVDIAARYDKKGYPTPVRHWLAGGNQQEISYLLLEHKTILHEWCDPEKVRRLVEQNRRGVMSADHHLYKLLSSQMWLKECIHA